MGGIWGGTSCCCASNSASNIKHLGCSAQVYIAVNHLKHIIVLWDSLSFSSSSFILSGTACSSIIPHFRTASWLSCCSSCRSMCMHVHQGVILCQDVFQNATVYCFQLGWSLFPNLLDSVAAPCFFVKGSRIQHQKEAPDHIDQIHLQIVQATCTYEGYHHNHTERLFSQYMTSCLTANCVD